MSLADKRMTPLNVGILPDGWGDPFLGEISHTITNGFVGQSVTHQTEDANAIRYIQGTNVRPNKIVFTRKNSTYISSEFHDQHKKSQLHGGEILTVQSGHIGITAVVPKELADSNCHAVIITRPDTERANPDYLSYYMNSSIGQARMRGLHVGSTILHINTSELAKYRVPLPARSIQLKIASVFKKWDKSIETIECLIDRSEIKRKALMQQLLTGKRRFPGFTKPWKEVLFSDIAKKVSRKNAAGITRVLTASGEHGLIDQAEYFKRSVASDDLTGYTHMKRGEFSYNRSAMNGYPCGAIKRLDRYDDGAVTTLYICFKLDEKCCSDYFMHLFEWGYLNRQLRRITPVGGRAHGLLNVTASDFYKMKLTIPEIKEQDKIAKTLNICMEEINILEKQLTAYQQQKRGLMQQLLTGKRRVKVPAA